MKKRDDSSIIPFSGVNGNLLEHLDGILEVIKEFFKAAGIKFRHPLIDQA
jgi:hypothetical protein